ncbi:MAG: YbaK/EbsC family protein, partial [Pseudomonadota bacterium]
MPDRTPAAGRVQRAATAAGLDIAVLAMDASTRTAKDAAAACGCEVAQIVKSLVFASEPSNRLVLLLVSGRNRVNEAAVSERIGTRLMRADAKTVRNHTGFAIGGIPPLGHDQPLATFIDEDLLTFDVV